MIIGLRIRGLTHTTHKIMATNKAPRYKSRADKTEYEKRLRTIARMAVRKVSEEEIASALGVDQTTVSRDLVEIQKRNLDHLRADIESWEESRDKLAAEIRFSFNEVERELWDEATGGKGSPRVAALKAVVELHKEKIQILQRLGLIYEEPTKEVVAENYDELLHKIEQRRKARSL